MPRKARCYHEAEFFHVMVQGDEKKYIFKRDESKERYIYLLKRNASKNDVKIIAYCAMDNHVHVLVFSKDIKNISKFMSQCNTAYARFFCRLRGEVGHVFRDRFRSEAITSKNYLLNCIRYIHYNPVKAEMVTSCGDYLYSSYNNYLRSMPREILELCEISNDEYMDLMKNSYTDMKYLDDELTKNDIEKLIEETISKYKMPIASESIKKIYIEIREKYPISQTQIAKRLGISRKKLKKILGKDQDGTNGDDQRGRFSSVPIYKIKLEKKKLRILL